MYTVLLVDDETMLLDSLSCCIPWQQFGIDSVLTADDATAALDILSRQTVHLLITDIKMPHIDGFTLLNKVRTLYPDIHCIILTAFAEFTYAKQALKLGIENYLLKPLQTAELEETIEKALNNLYDNKKISRHLFRQNILMRWANGSISSDELSERANLLDINLYLPEYCALTVSPKTENVFLSSYCRECVSQLSEAYEIHYFIDNNECGVFLIGGSGLLADKLTERFQTIAAAMNYPLPVTVKCGSIVYSAEQIAESYFHVDDEDFSLVSEFKILFQNEYDGHIQTFRAFAADFLSKANADTARNARILSNSLSVFFAQNFSKHPQTLSQLHDRLRIWCHFAENSLNEDTIVELLEYGYLLYRYCIEQLSPIVQNAMTYIHMHYADNIYIQDFCNKNKISPSYLGYLFKKETGIFFNNYLIQYRTCCSVKLLLNTNKKVNDIAQSVGFFSPAYFITCFKKQTGLTPVQYRRRFHP